MIVPLKRSLCPTVAGRLDVIGDGLQCLCGVSVHVYVLKTLTETFIWSHRRVSGNSFILLLLIWMYLLKLQLTSKIALLNNWMVLQTLIKLIAAFNHSSLTVSILTCSKVKLIMDSLELILNSCLLNESKIMWDLLKNKDKALVGSCTLAQRPLPQGRHTILVFIAHSSSTRREFRSLTFQIKCPLRSDLTSSDLWGKCVTFKHTKKGRACDWDCNASQDVRTATNIPLVCLCECSQLQCWGRRTRFCNLKHRISVKSHDRGHRGNGATVRLTIGNWRKFQDCVERTFQVRQLLWDRRHLFTLPFPAAGVCLASLLWRVCVTEGVSHRSSCPGSRPADTSWQPDDRWRGRSPASLAPWWPAPDGGPGPRTTEMHKGHFLSFHNYSHVYDNCRGHSRGTPPIYRWYTATQ